MSDFVITLEKYQGNDSCVVPSNVTKIGMRAFRNCTSLKSIEIPSSVTEIELEWSSFFGCTSLESINVASDNEMYMSIDGVLYSKDGKTLLSYPQGRKETSFVIPSTVTEIQKGAFLDCISITRVESPNGLTKIEKSAFYGCSSLASIEFPSSVTKIGDASFYNCGALTSIEIPSSVTELEENAFRACCSLKYIKYANDEAPAWWKERFSQDAIYLSALEYNDAESKIVKYVLRDKKKCIDIMVKNGNCCLISKLLEKSQKIKLVDLDELIDYASQYNNAEINLALLEYKHKHYSNNDIEKNEREKLDKAQGLKELTVADWKKIFKFKTENGEVTITGYVGSNTNVVIPETIGKSKVTKIKQNAFSDCKVITSLVLPSTLTEIQKWTFASCTSLKSIIISNGVTKIGEYAFYKCTSLTNVVIPSSVTSIEKVAFVDCEALTSIEIPSGVTEMDGSVFTNCTSLTSINVASDNKKYMSIDGVLYSKDGKVLVCYPQGKKEASFEIPNGVSVIQDMGFYRNDSLASVVIPNSMTEIQNGAFFGCGSLTSIEIPSGVTEIQEDAFYDCISLESINVVSDNETYMSIDGVLYSKDGKVLVYYPQGKKETSLVIPSSVNEIKESAFSGCTKLEKIEIPSGVTKIGEWAFRMCIMLTIYAEAKEQPEGWGENWNNYNRPVIWNYKK